MFVYSILTYYKYLTYLTLLTAKKKISKEIILLPDISSCLQCKNKNLKTSARNPSYPLVFTQEGTQFAVSFSSYCENCKIKYMKSYYVMCDGSVCFYENCLEESATYFQTSHQTTFTLSYLNDIINSIFSVASFEMLSICFTRICIMIFINKN